MINTPYMDWYSIWNRIFQCLQRSLNYICCMIVWLYDIPRLALHLSIWDIAFGWDSACNTWGNQWSILRCTQVTCKTSPQQQWDLQVQHLEAGRFQSDSLSLCFHLLPKASMFINCLHLTNSSYLHTVSVSDTSNQGTNSVLFSSAVPQEFQPAFEVELLGNERDVATLDMSCWQVCSWWRKK